MPCYIILHILIYYIICDSCRQSLRKSCRVLALAALTARLGRFPMEDWQGRSHYPEVQNCLFLSCCKKNLYLRTTFERNRGRRRIPCDALMNLDKLSASDAKSEPTSCFSQKAREPKNKHLWTSGIFCIVLYYILLPLHHAVP